VVPVGAAVVEEEPVDAEEEVSVLVGVVEPVEVTGVEVGPVEEVVGVDPLPMEMLAVHPASALLEALAEAIRNKLEIYLY